MTDLFAPVLVSGPDARTFLQGQLSCDVNSLTRDQSLLACVNSAQGRVQAMTSLSEDDEGVVLLIVSSMAEQTMQRLRKYVLRSKVTIANAMATFANRTLAFGELTSRASLLDFIRAGIPHVFPETHEVFVAQMLNLDALGAISFNKGCYTGQEIIARAHYRGAVKRRMFRFAANSSPPAPGARLVTDQNEHAGDVVYAAPTENGCELLAVVQLAHIDASLQLETTQTSLQKLSLPYSVDPAK